MTQERPLVSVVTVVYNGEKTLEHTITSVMDQTYPRIEYIVVDGGSTDGTLDIIKRHEKRISSWVSRPDDGLYFAMNEGISRCKGELIGIINSDDWYEPDAVATVVRAYLETDGQTVLYGITRYFDELGGLDMILSYDHSKLPSRMINHPPCFIPKAVYDRYGAFDTRFRVAADYDLMLRLFRAGVPFKHLEHILANFRHGGFSAKNKSTAEGLRIRLEQGYLTRKQYALASVERVVRRAIFTLMGRS